jgi:uncharacterized protein (TIGR02145 family)
MKLKTNKSKGRNLTKFLVAVTVLSAGIFGVQYIVNAISISNLTPKTGSTNGGEEVTITGDFALYPTPTTLQQMTPEYCANEMAVYPTTDGRPDTITLKDTRNNQDYRIRKLADNNCWFIDNLKLELEDGMTLTPADTDVATDITVNFDWANFTSGSAAHNDSFVTGGYLTKSGGSLNTNANYDAWRQANPNNAANCSNGTAYNSASETDCGYLYNFYTATASTAPTAQDAQYSTANGSICPAGWRLPSGKIASSGANGDFQNLDFQYGGAGVYHSGDLDGQDLWLPLGVSQGTFSGYYVGSLANQGVIGSYWSSTVVSATNAHSVSFSSNVISPGTDNGSRHLGFAVRCMTDGGVSTLPTVSVGGELVQVSSWSGSSISFVTPAHAAGKVDIAVTRGSESFVLTDGYEYLAPPTPNTPIPDVPNTGVAKTAGFSDF